MTRRFGIVTRTSQHDPLWTLRQFRPTLEDAQDAIVEESRDLLELGWTQGEVSIVSFDPEGLIHFEGYHHAIHEQRGQLRILVREPESSYLDIRSAGVKARKARQVAT